MIAILILETEKRGSELSINTFQYHSLCPATLGIALILDVRTYVSDIETRASDIKVHLTHLSLLS